LKSAHLIIPIFKNPLCSALLPEDPFYTKWWFLTIVALIALIVVMAFAAVLCFTSSGSSRYKSDKGQRGGAFDTLQLSDGGIVSYELHSKHRRKWVAITIKLTCLSFH